MKFLKTLIVISASLLLLTSCIPPGALQKNSGTAAKESTTLKGSDGVSQITIPAGWSESKTLHEEATIQASDILNEMYVLVFSENKDDFEGMTVDKYSELTRSPILEAIKSPQLSSPLKLTVNGYPALQYEIRGSVDNVKVVYLHVAVEGPDHFHQILTWTMPSLFEKNRSHMESVIASFKEIGSGDQSK